MESLRQSILADSTRPSPFRPPRDVIEGRLDLHHAQIGHIDFRHVVFRSFADFRHTHFCGLAWFDGAVFEAGADFSHAQFDRDARFDRARLAGETVFADSEFRGVADFDGAQFGALCNFDRAVFCANLSLGHAVFGDKVTFRGAQLHGGLWCRNAQFKALDAINIEISGRLFLDGSTARAINDPAQFFSGLKIIDPGAASLHSD